MIDLMFFRVKEKQPVAAFVEAREWEQDWTADGPAEVVKSVLRPPNAILIIEE